MRVKKVNVKQSIGTYKASSSEDIARDSISSVFYDNVISVLSGRVY